MESATIALQLPHGKLVRDSGCATARSLAISFANFRSLRDFRRVVPYLRARAFAAGAA